VTWNPDAPLEMLNRAARVYIELTSHAAYCNWLEQELPRVKIYLNFKSSVIYAASTEASGARDPQQPTPPLAATGAAPYIICCIRHGVKGGNTWIEHSPRCDGKCQKATSADPDFVSELVETLRFYADGDNYRDEWGGSPQDSDNPVPVLGDGGLRASAVLGKYGMLK